MNSKCEYCQELTIQFPLILKCCGFMVCYVHCRGLKNCLICDKSFNLQECLSMLRNKINLKFFEFNVVVEDFKRLVEKFRILSQSPEKLLNKHKIIDLNIKDWLIKQLETIQIDEIELKTNLLINQTIDNFINFSNKLEFVEMIDRRTEIIEELNCNLTIEEKLIEILTSGKCSLEKSINIVIDKFELDQRQNLIATSLDDSIKKIDLKLNITSTIAHIGTKLVILCIRLLESRFLICGLSDGRIISWDLKLNKCIFSFQADHSEICCLEIFKKNYFVSGSCSGKMKLWNQELFECKIVYKDQNQNLKQFERVSKSKFASCSNENIIKLWSIKTDYCLEKLTGHESSVNSLKLIKKNLLASGSSDGTIKLWNIMQGNCIKTLTDDSKNAIMCINVTYKNKIIAGTVHGKIKMWNYGTQEILFSKNAHESCVNFIKESKQGYLISHSNDKTIKLWKYE